MTTSSISNVNALFQPTGSQTGAPRGIVSDKKIPVGVDQFHLSPSAMAIQQLLNQTEDGKSDPDNALSGLEVLKQSGEMLAGLLQSKLKNFQTDLTSTLQTAGLNPAQAMAMQQGVDGLLLTNTPPADKEQITKLLGKDSQLVTQFQEISRLAELLGMLQQNGTNTAAATTAAARYAQQSQMTAGTPKPNPDARFVLNVMQGSASYSFE